MSDALQFKPALAALSVGIASLIGGFSPLLGIMLVMMLADFGTGFLGAALRRELASSKMFDGAIRKIIMLAVVLLAYQIGNAISLPWLRDAVIVYYIINEALSILENAVLAGVRIPSFLTVILKKAGELAETGKGVGE
jgi:toxin secretion/phage lysis holin